MIRISDYFKWYCYFHDSENFIDRLKRVFKREFISKLERERGCHPERRLPFNPEKMSGFAKHENRYFINLFRQNPRMLFNRRFVAMDHVDVVLTTRCTLSCRDCSHLIPEYGAGGRTPLDIPAEQVIKDLRHLTAAVDYIASIVVMGGEPFLHKELPAVLEYASKNKKIGNIQIVSNGTIIPKKSLLDSIRNSNAQLHINDYGFLFNADIYEKLAAANIKYRVAHDRVWKVFGKTALRQIAEDALEKKAEDCHFATCKNLMDGRLAGCAVSQHGERTGLIPRFEGDRIDIHSFSADELRREIVKLYRKPYYECCRYCGYGGVSETVEAGIQNA